MDGEGALIDEPPCVEEPPAAVKAVLRPEDPEASRRTAATGALRLRPRSVVLRRHRCGGTGAGRDGLA